MTDDTKAKTEQPEPQSVLDAHKRLVVLVSLATLAIGGPLLFSLLWLYSTGRGPTIMVAVMLSGALGAFVSALKRLYAFQTIFPDKTYAKLFRRLDLYSVIYAVVPALVGMIGAAFVYVVFAGGLLVGPLFPKFTSLTGEECRTFAEYVRYWSPAGPAEYSKAIAWGFVAGFSERFVPDILNGLIARTESDLERRS